ncbi:ABC-three component system protein [Clostridium sp.]|uniref:ABC-three component system protein n=1 Tax=Clostridium sp. TaxID=1506 RepID=UPI002FC7741B
MKLEEIQAPKLPENYNPYTGIAIAPLDRLKIMDDGEFEDLIIEWANDYLKTVYYKVAGMAGSGDKGRDVVAYYNKTDFDIYQCKHYGEALSPSKYWVEFGKLCYYTYKKDYRIPVHYYIVASKGIGQALRDLLDNPEEINKELVRNWNKYCKKKITLSEEVVLDDEFKKYVEEFDFSIVDDIPQIKLLEQHSLTKWHKFRFGGGLKKRSKPVIPESIDGNEIDLLYVQQLLEIYFEISKGQVNDINTLKRDDTLFNHFSRQREDYHLAQALKRFTRDEYIDFEPYNDIKSEIYRGVIDISLEEFSNLIKKVNDTLKVARSLPLQSIELGIINPSEKAGMCHELVNETKLKWVDK